VNQNKQSTNEVSCKVVHDITCKPHGLAVMAVDSQSEGPGFEYQFAKSFQSLFHSLRVIEMQIENGYAQKYLKKIYF